MKYFKRILKELGIYHKWVKARKRYELNYPNDSKYFYILTSKSSLCHLVDSSFVWCDTDNVDLWLDFSEAAASGKWETAEEFCCDEGIKYLKEHLKKYIENEDNLL